MSINTHGAAIAIVRGQELLYLRSFSWSYAPGRPGSTAQLLQRYTLVAHLAPELQRGIAAVRASHDCGVDTAVTCGDLPDLRSLTMPLIEELNLEVETLDSLEGFRSSAARGASDSPRTDRRFVSQSPRRSGQSVRGGMPESGAPGRPRPWSAPRRGCSGSRMACAGSRSRLR